MGAKQSLQQNDLRDTDLDLVWVSQGHAGDHAATGTTSESPREKLPSTMIDRIESDAMRPCSKEASQSPGESDSVKSEARLQLQIAPMLPVPVPTTSVPSPV